ncbi:MAG TPA: sugar ABC transporter ATP-binding protein, partial [Tepidisphaeraceae bacterium]|nr:sugar ABC transporter ATP-binding protein [Tepidisphaeraceae bacterium]
MAGTNMAGDPALIAVDGVGKSFPGVRALDGVSFDVRPGEVHGLIGENGAGKSTLMKLLSGLYQPDHGKVLVGGRAVRINGPLDAQRHGVAIIHQELNLVDHLSVADNIFLGRERTTLGFVRAAAARRRAAELLAGIDCPIDPAARVASLSIAQKQMVEIAKAMSQDASVLIMDEPTAVLTAREVRALFDLVGRLKARGVGVVYISHILPEVVAICDRVTVMRDGRVVQTLDRPRVHEIGEKGLASLMVGRPMSDHFPPRGHPGQRVVLEVTGLTVPGKVRNVTLAVREGEILGFAGLIGAGRTEMAEAIAGLRAKSAGTIRVDGRDVAIRGPRDAVAAGIAYLSEDRKGTGLTLGMGIAENATMVSLPRYAKPFINRRAEDRAAERQVAALKIKVGHVRDDVATLSGGNQQKVALAK